jgi:hypothetical protein
MINAPLGHCASLIARMAPSATTVLLGTRPFDMRPQRFDEFSDAAIGAMCDRLRRIASKGKATFDDLDDITTAVYLLEDTDAPIPVICALETICDRLAARETLGESRRFETVTDPEAGAITLLIAIKIIREHQRSP